MKIQASITIPYAVANYAKEILKPVGQRAVIIMRQGGYQQTFPETAGTQEHGGFIGLETWNVIRLIHIIKTTVTHFGIIGPPV